MAGILIPAKKQPKYIGTDLAAVAPEDDHVHMTTIAGTAIVMQYLGLLAERIAAR